VAHGLIVRSNRTSGLIGRSPAFLFDPERDETLPLAAGLSREYPPPTPHFSRIVCSPSLALIEVVFFC
jgi:hypothetical protein